jgi:hypothetical protein
MMNRSGLTLAAVLLLAVPAHAVVGTCTITKLEVVGNLVFPIPGANGATLGTDVGAGTFALDRTPFHQQFPPPGVSYNTFGFASYLTLGTGVATGSMDSTGNVSVPGVDMTFGTTFGAGPEGPLRFDLNVHLMTGLQAPVLSGSPVLFEGTPLDRATGSLRVLGAAPLSYQGVNMTGPGLMCTIAPIPDLASQPAGPVLALVKGKAVVNPGGNDDELTLTAKLKHGATPPALDGTQDVVLRLRRSDGQFVTALAVQDGKFTVKGKKATATDPGDGTIIQFAKPYDSIEDAQEPVTGGTLTLKRGKKASTLIWKVQGATLDAFTGTVNVAIAVGPQTVYRDVTVTSGKKGPKFK